MPATNHKGQSKTGTGPAGSSLATETAKSERDLPEWLKVKSKPLAIRILLIINTIIFAAMSGASGLKSLFIPSSQVLLHFGASSGASTIVAGQFWRLATSAFVHIGFLHLMMNCYVIWDIGPLVERLYGWRKFLAVYLISALGAALTSLMFNPTVVSAGASGAIFGLFGALCAFFRQHRADFPSDFLKLNAKIIVIFIVYGIAYGAIMAGVDNAAHIGGLISGFLVGLALMPSEPGHSAFRRSDGLVTAAICVCFLGFLAADCKSIAGNQLVLGDSAYQQAVELLQSQKNAEALPLLSKAAALMPKIASVRWDRARAYSSLGRFDDAIADCNSAIGLEPNSKTGYVVRSSVYHKKGDNKKAIYDLTTVIKLEPHNAMAYNNRAWEYLATGDQKSALADVDTAIKMDRTESTFYDTRGVAYCASARLDEALKDLNRALSMKHTEGAFYYHRALVFEKLKQTELARKDKERAASFGFKPEDWETRI